MYDLVALLALWIWIFSLTKQGLIPEPLGYLVIVVYILFRAMGRIIGGEFGRSVRKLTIGITVASLFTMLIVLGYGGFKNVASLFIEFVIYLIVFAVIYLVIVNMFPKRRA